MYLDDEAADLIERLYTRIAVLLVYANRTAQYAQEAQALFAEAKAVVEAAREETSPRVLPRVCPGVRARLIHETVVKNARVWGGKSEQAAQDWWSELPDETKAWLDHIVGGVLNTLSHHPSKAGDVGRDH